MTKKEERAQKAVENRLLAKILSDRSQGIVNKEAARKANAITTIAARDNLFLSQMIDAMKVVFKDKLPAPPKPQKSKEKTARILNVVLSDLHYGARLDAREVGHPYGPVEEARRTASVCRQVADYKRQYRNETELYVHILGDIIQGQLHDPRDGAPLAEQVATAMRLLVQALTYFSHEFPKGVTVFCTTGNHDRSKARHHDRGVNQKWDSISMMIYAGLKEAMRDYKNIKFVIPLSPYYTWKAFDQKGWATHGDTCLRGGYPGQSIQVASVTEQINSINAAAGKKGEEYSLFMIGHVHTGSMTHLPGAIFMTNGCLLPPDSFAVSIGILEGACGQWMFESVKGHIVGDSRFISVSSICDNDKSLDAIVKPFAWT